MKKNFENFLGNSRRYFDRYARKEAFAWYSVFRYYLVLLPLVLLAIIAVIFYVKPFVPKSAYLAVGQVGSSYGVMGEKFKTILARYGINLELVKTDGLLHGLIKLDDPNSVVNASFVTAGAATENEYPSLVSLGSVQYAPIWIFYKGKKLDIDDPFRYFANRKIGIGLPGTNSNKMYRRTLLTSNQESVDTQGLIELPHIEAAEKLKAGDLDAVFIVDSFSAPVVQSLITDENIHVLNINLADAYVKKYPFLQKLFIPRGSLNLDKIIPKEDIVLLSATTNLLVEEGTHPAVQWAFMLASNELGKFSEDFFSKPGDFPKYLDLTFPLSPVAKRFYTQGQPAVFDYLPLWLASLVVSAWLLILAFLALIYPIIKWIISMRAYPSKKFMQQNFVNLRDLDDDIEHAKTKDEIEALLLRLNVLFEKNDLRWLSKTEARFYFTKKSIMLGMKKQLNEKLVALDKQ